MIPDIRVIWNKVVAGDAGAWEELVELYAVLVYTVAIRVGLSEADAEDCAQDVWLALYRKRNSIRDPKAIPAWLIKTTRRRAVELARRTRNASNEFEIQLSAESEAADNLVITAENQRILEQALSQLDPRCRMLLENLYLQGHGISYSRLAKQLGLSPNSLGPLRSRCLVKLAKILEKMHFCAD
jgi:RNA polymerase sigma factor (sigma-70 family)